MLDTTNDDGFQRELARAAAARREHEHLLVQRQAAADEVGTASTDVEERRAALVKEHEDVVRLESVSLTRVLTSLRGERDDSLQREMAERETARVAFLAAEERLRAALRDLTSIDDRLAALGDVEAEWERVIDARERWVLATGEAATAPTPTAAGGAATAASHSTAAGPDAARVAALVERRGVLEAEMREVDEALASAHMAAARLALASSVLGSAQSWSTYDTWFGGGMLSSMFKHDKLDDASATLRQVDLALATLRRELADLARAGVSTLTFDRWDRSFDTFFDNFFSDLQVDRRIKAAAEQVAQLRAEVDLVVVEVQAQGHALAAEATELAAERRRLLT